MSSRVLPLAHPRVAEHARARAASRFRKPFSWSDCGRLFEEQELELAPRTSPSSPCCSARARTRAQERARARRVRRRRARRESRRGSPTASGLPGDGAQRREVDHRVGVGVAGVPAGDLRVVVEDVGDVPAEDDVAEAEAGSSAVFSFSSETYLPRRTPSMSKPPIFALVIPRCSRSLSSCSESVMFSPYHAG